MFFKLVDEFRKTMVPVVVEIVPAEGRWARMSLGRSVGRASATAFAGFRRVTAGGRRAAAAGSTRVEFRNSFLGKMEPEYRRGYRVRSEARAERQEVEGEEEGSERRELHVVGLVPPPFRIQRRSSELWSVPACGPRSISAASEDDEDSKQILRRVRMNELLLELLNRLEAIGQKHEEIYDSEVRDQMREAVHDGLLDLVPDYKLPYTFGLGSDEGNRSVRETLGSYIETAKAKAQCLA